MKVIIAVFVVIFNCNVLSAADDPCSVSASSHCKVKVKEPLFPYKKEWTKDYYLYLVDILECHKHHAVNCFHDTRKAAIFDLWIRMMNAGYENRTGVKSGGPVPARDCKVTASEDCKNIGGELPYPYENEWRDGYCQNFIANLKCKIDHALICDSDISQVLRLDRWIHLAERVCNNDTFIARNVREVNCENAATVDCFDVGGELPHSYTSEWLETYCEPFLETATCLRDRVLNDDLEKHTLPTLIEWIQLSKDFCDEESVQRQILEKTRDCSSAADESPDCAALFGEDLPSPYTTGWLNLHCGPFIAHAKCMRNHMLQTPAEEHTSLILDKWIDFAGHLCNLNPYTHRGFPEASTNCSMLASLHCSETVKELPDIKTPEWVDNYCGWSFIKNLRCQRDHAVSCDTDIDMVLNLDKRIDTTEQICRSVMDHDNNEATNQPINCTSFAAQECLSIGGGLPYPDSPDWREEHCMGFNHNLKCKKDHMLHCELGTEAALDLDRWIEFGRRVCYGEIVIHTTTDPSDPSNCDTTFPYCPDIDDIIPRITAPEWLSVYCEHLLTTFKCRRAQALTCDDGITSAITYERWISYGEEVCDESSSIHKDIEQHYSCYYEIAKTRKCVKENLLFQDVHFFFNYLFDRHLFITYKREEHEIGEMCLQLFLESVCYIGVLEEECGTKAVETFEYIFKHFLLFKPCNVNVRDRLPKLIDALKDYAKPKKQRWED